MTKNIVNNYDADTFEKKLKEYEDSVLIDVRTDMEYMQGRIPNSELMDCSQPDILEKLDNLDREKKYFVYCRSGARSSAVASKMIEMGFKYVANLTNGIISWDKEIVI